MTGDRTSKQSAYQWRLIPASEFSRHMPAWNSVLSQSEHSPVLEPAFIDALISVFGRGNEVLAICGESHAPHAMGILVPNRFGTWDTFQPSQAPLGLWLHRPGLAWEKSLPQLMATLPGFPLVLGISQQDPAVLPRPTDLDHIRTLDFVQTARIRVNRPFDEYWKARDDNLRHQIERRLRRVHENGIEPRLEAITDPAAVPAAIEEFGRIESAGWKGRLGTAIHIDNIQGTFYCRLLQEFCARGHGVVYRYRFNDITAAMELCIDGGDTLIMLKTAYDEAYREHSPGILMRREIFRRAFTGGRFNKIEFLGKLQPWQEKWCDEVRTLYHLTYYRWRWLIRTQALRRAAARAIDVVQHSGKAAGGAVGRTADKFLNRADAFGETIRRLGWLNGCLFTFDWLLVAISGGRARLHKYYFMAQPVADRRWLPLKRGADIEIRRVTETDPVIGAFPRPVQTIPYRFGQGAICLAELKAGRWIGFLWLTLGPYQEDEVRCRYVPLPAGNAAWDFDVYLEPEHRNGIAFLKLWDEANSFLAAREVRWSLSRISAFNRGSILSHSSMGAKRIGTVTFLSIGSCQISAATVPPYLHFSTHPDSFPTFSLNPEQAGKDGSARQWTA